MRNFDEKRITTNSYVWKRVAIYSLLGCPLCSPNKGCNRSQRWNPSRSWKDQSKKRKQWM